ncbi:putative Ig domain-containing protein [Nonomuraea ferruginea]
MTAKGGVPFYDWQIDGGTLPAGLSLDRFTGAITGTPHHGSARPRSPSGSATTTGSAHR